MKELTSALSEDMVEFRESELLPSGKMVCIRAAHQSKSLHKPLVGSGTVALMDALGRVYAPATRIWFQADSIAVGEIGSEEWSVRSVLRRENRYHGNAIAQVVLYLEKDDADQDHC